MSTCNGVVLGHPCTCTCTGMWRERLPPVWLHLLKWELYALQSQMEPFVCQARGRVHTALDLTSVHEHTRDTCNMQILNTEDYLHFEHSHNQRGYAHTLYIWHTRVCMHHVARRSPTVGLKLLPPADTTTVQHTASAMAMTGWCIV